MEIPIAQRCHQCDDKEDSTAECPHLAVLHLIAISFEELLEKFVKLLLLLAELHLLHPVLLASLHLVKLAHLPIEELVPLVVLELCTSF